MNYKIKILQLLFLSWIFLSCQKQGQVHEPDNYKLFVTLESAPFDSIYLFDYTDKYIYIAGNKIDKSTWKFIIPDSIVDNSKNMSLRISNKYDSVSNSLREVRFIILKDGKKTIIANIGVEDKENYIHGTYMKQSIFPDEYFRVKVNDKDSAVLGNIICEDFRLIFKNDSSDITVRAQDPLFSRFENLNDEEVSYDEYMARYIAISRKYPDSRFLINNLSRTLTDYKSKKDIQTIYDNLSDKHKNTIWAKNIERFLSAKFENTSLPISDKTTYEKIIQDSTRFNLIIFTASWCGPCIEEIPILKKIHRDLNKNLILTYISIDEEITIDSYQKLMREKNIPWRSLLAFKNIREIKEKYFVDGIPHCILVYPNRNMEIIDIRENYQQDRLYSLCMTDDKKE